MPELRKDYVLNRYVIIASERAKRPHELIVRHEPKPAGICYFCPGSEHLTPPETQRLEKDGEWAVRVFPNKFPAVMQKGNFELQSHNSYYTFSDAFGYHEVVAETPEHHRQLADLSESQLFDVISVYKARVEVLSQKEGVKYVSVFKNHGEAAGCSIEHSHTQIISYNILPSIVQEKATLAKEYGRCPYCEVLQKERNSFRHIYEDQNVLVFAPYASRFPYEAWIYPTRHITSFREASVPELKSFAAGMKLLLARLKDLNAPYNFFFQYGPGVHFHLELLPRFEKVIWAGFEHSTETIINPVPPEDAAVFYRKL